MPDIDKLRHSIKCLDEMNCLLSQIFCSSFSMSGRITAIESELEWITGETELELSELESALMEKK